MKVLLTGRNGQVSRALQKQLGQGVDLQVLGQAQLDLGDTDAIRRQVRELKPDLIINAAAYTLVDRAQNETEQAFAINAVAPGVLAEEAAKLDSPLIHYSTDYVFDGSKATPYDEDDITHPLNVYGASKLTGENAIRAVAGTHLILRTSWVYSQHGNNFLLTMQRLLQEREELRVVDDQIGAPTWAGSIAQATAELIGHWRNDQAGPWGTYHLSAQGETSWFGFASAIAEHLRTGGAACARLQPIPGSAYPTPAQRPQNSRLDCTRLQRDWRIQLPDWRAALRECLSEPS
ncbi:dTDP-4-dehydrorhamnose reductase [Pseudomonas sp. Marseille-Q8238]